MRASAAPLVEPVQLAALGTGLALTVSDFFVI
jgi:hypothetical protein